MYSALENQAIENEQMTDTLRIKEKKKTKKLRGGKHQVTKTTDAACTLHGSGGVLRVSFHHIPLVCLLVAFMVLTLTAIPASALS